MNTKIHPDLKSADSLSGHKETTAYILFQKEELNAKKSRMECLLNQNFISKYGSKQPNSRINSFIKATVADFLDSYNNMSVAESMIESLESQIREISSKMRMDVQSKRNAVQQLMQQKSHSVSDLSASDYNNNNNNRSNSGNGSRRNSSGGNNSLPLINPKHGSGSQQQLDPSWSVLNAIMALSEEDKQKKEAKEAWARKEIFRHELDRQRQANESKRELESKEKGVLLEQAKKVVQSVEAEKEVIAHKKEAKFEYERVTRLAQIEERKSVKERERQIKIAQERMEMARSRRLAEDEAEEVNRKKEVQKKAQDKVFLENEANKMVKAEIQKKQWEYEAKLNVDYENKLAREEQARENALKARMDQLKAFEGSYDGMALSKKKEVGMALEKVMNEVDKKNRGDEERELLKVEIRKKEMMRSREFNLTLIDKKQRIKDEERKKDLEMRARMEAELVEQKSRERSLLEAKRIKMIDLKINLDKQVSQRHQVQEFSKGPGLSSLEISLNQAIIKKIENDPDLFEKVLERVKPPPQATSTGFKWG